MNMIVLLESMLIPKGISRGGISKWEICKKAKSIPSTFVISRKGKYSIPEGKDLISFPKRNLKTKEFNGNKVDK